MFDDLKVLPLTDEPISGCVLRSCPLRLYDFTTDYARNSSAVSSSSVAIVAVFEREFPK